MKYSTEQEQKTVHQFFKKTPGVHIRKKTEIRQYELLCKCFLLWLDEIERKQL